MHNDETTSIKQLRENISGRLEVRILRKPEVKEITGLPDSTLYDYIKKGNFPPPIKIGPRSSGWLQSEVLEWVNEKVRIAKNRNMEDL